jgi:plasmid replication initiation protein
MRLMAKEKKYGLSTVAQSNKLVEAIHGMTLTEKRLFIHASGLARQQDLKEGEVLTIRADEFARECGIESHTAYEGLQDAVDRLFGRYFSYVSGAGNPVKCRWVYRLEYKNGMGQIDVSFPAEVIYMFTVFNKDNPFTTYDRKHIQQMTSVYAIRFYELFMQYRSIGNRTLELNEIKTMFQLDEKYDRIFDLKKRVVDVALEQINQHTDYTVTYEQVKRGRTVHALKFYFAPKKPVIEHKKVSKPKPPKNISTLAGFELVLFKEITANHPEITEKYVREYAEQSGDDLLQALQKIKADYKAAEEFSLEKTN